MVTGSRRIWAVSGLSLVGFVVSALQSKQFYEMRSGTAGLKSFCNFSDTFNCDAVMMSPYAELVGGIPLSSFAAGWFIAIFLVSLFARGAFWHRESVRALFAMTAFGSVMSMIWLSLMAFQLQVYCIECLTVDTVIFASLALVLSLKPEGLSKTPLDFDKWKTFAGVTAGALLVAIVFLKQMETSFGSDADMELIAQSVVESPVLSVASGPEFPSIGPANAPITIVEFSDFQCPFCRVGASTLKSLSYRHPGKIRVVLRNFPLDPACNPKMKSAGHPAACEAARGVYCAFKQGKFEAAYETIFENQEKLKTSAPTSFIKALPGLDAAQFDACMNGPESAQQVSRDLADGEVLGVQGTPAFFVNGKRVQGFPSIKGWSRIIERLAPTATK
jgi:protein-disulfide isomerase